VVALNDGVVNVLPVPSRLPPLAAENQLTVPLADAERLTVPGPHLETPEATGAAGAALIIA